MTTYEARSIYDGRVLYEVEDIDDLVQQAGGHNYQVRSSSLHDPPTVQVHVLAWESLTSAWDVITTVAVPAKMLRG